MFIKFHASSLSHFLLHIYLIKRKEKKRNINIHLAVLPSRNNRQARWALYLSRFDFTLKHVPGSSMGRADSLSRYPDWQIGVERDNENRVLVKREWLEVRATQVAEIIIEGVDLLEKIKKSDTKDDEVIKVVEEMK